MENNHFYKFRSKESGLSLIEVSIALIVIGLLLVPLIHIYDLEQIRNKVHKTESSLSYVRDSLTKFAVENGRYPLPAVRNLTSGSVGAGVEFTGVIIPCVTGATNPCRTPGAPAVRVIIGDVPFKALGINVENIVDGYGGKLTYAITQTLTNVGTFSDVGGIITLFQRDGVTNEPQTVDAASNPNVHFVLISHGEDNSGAFSLEGGTMNVCPTGGASNRDTVNCDHIDTLFTTNSELTCAVGLTPNFGTMLCDDLINIPTPPSVPGQIQRAQYSVPGASHYDDYVSFSTSTQGYIWSYAVGAPNMQSRNPGNALIGAIPASITTGTGPRPETAVAKLEVMGNMRTDTLFVDRICRTSGNAKITNPLSTCVLPVPNAALIAPDDIYDRNVFDPAIIAVGTVDVANNAGLAGGGIYCKGNGLRGIANSDEECVGVFPAAFSGNAPSGCSGGTFPRGVLASGLFDCIIPP